MVGDRDTHDVLCQPDDDFHGHRLYLLVSTALLLLGSKIKSELTLSRSGIPSTFSACVCLRRVLSVTGSLGLLYEYLGRASHNQCAVEDRLRASMGVCVYVVGGRKIQQRHFFRVGYVYIFVLPCRPGDMFLGGAFVWTRAFSKVLYGLTNGLCGIGWFKTSHGTPRMVDRVTGRPEVLHGAAHIQRTWK